ncbi:unnamed protein product [Heligmosomoides polygyrus]|uniref:Transposase n=1 Tax=Heligmosomoides polygyrus TaxID=6339 RepID=A0A183FLZ2_HELPZ|nr:unnamed protein product [Heligmosomoides polygyrus]
MTLTPRSQPRRTLDACNEMSGLDRLLSHRSDALGLEAARNSGSSRRTRQWTYWLLTVVGNLNFVVTGNEVLWRHEARSRIDKILVYDKGQRVKDGDQPVL